MFASFIFSAAEPSLVATVTEQVRGVLRSWHRPESVYVVQNLTQLVAVADRVGNALTLVLLLIASVTLVVSGTGIMNIMLANVSSRIHEIGIRKAIGAISRDIRFRVLVVKSILISLFGGLIGVLVGLTAATFAPPSNRIYNPDLGAIGAGWSWCLFAGGYFVWKLPGGTSSHVGPGK